MDRSGKKRGSSSNYELLKKFRAVHKTYDSDSSLSCDSDDNKRVPEQKDLKRVDAEQNEEREPPAYFSNDSDPSDESGQEENDRENFADESDDFKSDGFYSYASSDSSSYSSLFDCISEEEKEKLKC